MEPGHEFISAAEWPDDIKGQNWKSFNPLHFVNVPVIDPSFTGEIKTSDTNSTYGIVTLLFLPILGALQAYPVVKG